MKYPSSMPPTISRPSADWDALTDPDTGRLRASVPLDALLLAERVEVVDAALVFDWRLGFNYIKPPSTLLEQFLGLRTDAGMLGFARRFGPLGLSEHAVGPAPQPFNHRRERQRESLAEWHKYQWEFNALLALAGALREQRSPARELIEELERRGLVSPEHQETIGSILKPGPSLPSVLGGWSEMPASGRLRFARAYLQSRTATFVQACRIRPVLVPGEDEPYWTPSRFTLLFQDAVADGRHWFRLSLFGALTVQLLAAATGSGYAVCSSCGSVFVPRRRQPAFGKRRYCRRCGRRAALKDAKADFRVRQRAKTATRKRGSS